MIQDIAPKYLDNQYKNILPSDEDVIFFFEGSSVLAKPVKGFDVQRPEDGEILYPTYNEFIQSIDVDEYSFIYLFSVDDNKYFLSMKKDAVQKGQYAGEMADASIHKEFSSFVDGFEFMGVNSFRKAKPKETAFAAITAYHLYGWYRDNKFCGRCGQVLKHDDKERMMRCDCCKNMIFPKICPAVIVAVTNENKILLTKYAGRAYTNYALIAGFTEIGESTEQTVKREVLEEVGVNVKNITYYKSQPWGLSGSQLFGYYCELDGSEEITLQEDELSVGTWVEAKDIDIEDDGISLTREMIEKFRREHI